MARLHGASPSVRLLCPLLRQQCGTTGQTLAPRLHGLPGRTVLPRDTASPQSWALAGLTANYWISFPAQDVNGLPKWEEVSMEEKELWRVLRTPSCKRSVSRAERGQPSLGNHTQASPGETWPLPLRTSWQQRSTGDGASAPISTRPATPQWTKDLSCTS